MIVMAHYVLHKGPAQGAYEEGMHLSIAYTCVYGLLFKCGCLAPCEKPIGHTCPPHHTSHDQSNTVTHFYIPSFLTMIQMGPDRWIEI